MGASYNIKGVRDLDDKFKKIMAVKSLCDEQEMSYPKEVNKYFQEVTDEGYDISTLSEDDLADAMGTTDIEYVGDIEYGSGVTIDVDDIPSDVKQIRIFMSC